MPHPFDYVKPEATQLTAMGIVNVHVKAAYDALVHLAPDNESRTNAIAALQSARMWANAALLGIDADQYARQQRPAVLIQDDPHRKCRNCGQVSAMHGTMDTCPQLVGEPFIPSQQPVTYWSPE